MNKEIDPSSKVFHGVEIGNHTIIKEFSIVGKPYRLVDGERYEAQNKTKIGNSCHIGSHVIICEGSEIGDKSNIEDFTKIEQDVRIGRECHLIYGTQIGNEASIGDNCIIAGFICERAQIGKDTRVFGKLIHGQYDPASGWDDTEESSPIIGNNAFIGFDAKIIGEVVIGEHAYVCAGAIVTKDVPSYHVAFNVNQIIHYKEWKGLLSESNFFRG